MYYSDTSGASSTTYIYAGSELVAFVDTGTTTSSTSYVHPDHLGSTHIVTSASSTVVQALDYYPYGSTRINNNTTNTDLKKQYVGRYFDNVATVSYLIARYYKNDQGQFISEDPVFWRNPLKQQLNNPQSLNSYSYANGNPINLTDPNGEKATKAQQIKVLKAQVRILQGIVNLYKGGHSKQANAAFSAYQTAFGNSSGEPINSSIPIGVRTSTPNITVPLSNLMQKNSENLLINNPYYFRNKVKPGGDWDIKNTPEYSTRTYTNGFIFDGKHVNSDAPGNIHYGYVGASAFWDKLPGTGPQLLLREAGAVQTKSQPEWQNSNFYGDDPVDQVNILWGIDMYYNR